MGTVAFTMLPGRYGGTEALVVRTNLHPVPINQERHSSLGGRSVAAARATLPGTGFGTWTLRIEAGDSVSTEIATAAATGFRSPLVLPLGFLWGKRFCHRHRASHGISRRACRYCFALFCWAVGLAEEDRSLFLRGFAQAPPWCKCPSGRRSRHSCLACPYPCRRRQRTFHEECHP